MSIDNSIKEQYSSNSLFKNFSHTKIIVCIICIIGFFFLTLFILNASLNKGTPARDSGIFLYIGNEILHGKIPYRDMWEHKPPLIFYINALGLLLISGPKLWGIWFLEFMNIFLSAILSFFLLKKIFGIIPGLLSTFVWLIYIEKFLQGGNQIEEYGLILLFSSLFLFYWIDTQKRRFLPYLLLGIINSLIFLLKPNLIGILLSIAIYIVVSKSTIKECKKVITKITVIMIGFVIIPLFVSLYFWLNGVFFDLIDQTLIFNFSYINVDLSKRVFVITTFLQRNPTLTLLFFLGILISIYLFLKRKDIDYTQLSIIKLSFILFPINLCLISLSGRAYEHYYLPLFPLLSIYIALLVYFILIQLQNVSISKIWHTAITITIMILISSPQLLFLLNRNIEEKIIGKNFQIRWFFFNNFQEHQETINFIKKNTQVGDYVLIWGAEASLNFISQRPSPTRYFIQYPLFTLNYSNDTKFSEFTEEVETNNPKIIIDASGSTIDQGVSKNAIVPPIDADKRKAWLKHKNYSPEGLDYFFGYVKKNYEDIGFIENKKWRIYRRKIDNQS
ncbi:hypothetical protein C4577_07720 [Candidatus Parcubacteria bacterium]|nr:MAG: hypothetical protein C4577_07720 [Candidatus Parcubacteria bacterium]